MDTYVVKYAGTGLSVIFSQLSASSETRIEFLDPFCATVKLGVLTFKPNGTKISIHNNTIHIQEPSTFQGVMRWLNSDERDQLHQLRLPILYFRGVELGHIVIDDFKIDKDQMASINEFAVQGLIKLKTTYETAKKVGSMVKNCLDDYIKTLSHPYSKEEYMKELSSLDKPTMFVIYKEFMKKWDNTDIDTILNLFGKTKKVIDKTKETLSSNVHNEIANSIDHFIMAKDLEIDSLRPD